MGSKSATEKPLKFVCRCGYRKSLPEKYAGKRLICPKCSTVLRIEKLNRKAELLVRCPKCRDIFDFEANQTVCKMCEFEYELPATFSKPPAEQRETFSPTASLLPGSDKPSDESPDEISSIVITGKSLKRRRDMTNWIYGLGNFALICAVGWLLIDKYVLENEINTANPTVVAQANNEATNIPGSESAEVVAESNTEDKASAIPLPPPPPKLTAPTLELLGIEHEIAQGLDPENSEVMAERLFVDLKMKNLSDCKITKIEATIQLVDKLFVKKESKHTFEFERPFEPSDVRVAVAAFRIQPMTGAIVTIDRVWAEEQSEDTTIRKEFSLDAKPDAKADSE